MQFFDFSDGTAIERLPEIGKEKGSSRKAAGKVGKWVEVGIVDCCSKRRNDKLEEAISVWCQHVKQSVERHTESTTAKAMALNRSARTRKAMLAGRTAELRQRGKGEQSQISGQYEPERVNM